MEQQTITMEELKELKDLSHEQLKTLIQIREIFAGRIEPGKPKVNLEKNTGKRITKSAGYIPLATSIRMMEEAGIARDKLIQGIFDYGPEDKIAFGVTDPTRKPSFDLADASETLKRGAESFQELATTYKAKIQAKRAEIKAENQKKLDTMVSMGDSKDKTNNRQGEGT